MLPRSPSVPVRDAPKAVEIVMLGRHSRDSRLPLALRLVGMTHVNPTDDELREILSTSRTIAMVGASSSHDRPSLGVMKVLLAAGFEVIPVTPRETSILGRATYATLIDVPQRVDIVDVFRRADHTPAIADEAVRIGAKVLWLQLGIVNEEAATRARAGGLSVVMDLCIGKTVTRLGIKHAKV
jgi:predicted CoA-binding protein